MQIKIIYKNIGACVSAFYLSFICVLCVHCERILSYKLREVSQISQISQKNAEYIYMTVFSPRPLRSLRENIIIYMARGMSRYGERICIFCKNRFPSNDSCFVFSLSQCHLFLLVSNLSLLLFVNLQQFF